jgi:predicted Zn finger-like uncharacterized protein
MANIIVQCPQCSTSGQVDEGWVGRNIRCGKCQTSFTVAAEPSLSLTDPPVADISQLPTITPPAKVRRVSVKKPRVQKTDISSATTINQPVTQERTGVETDDKPEEPVPAYGQCCALVIVIVVTAATLGTQAWDTMPWYGRILLLIGPFILTGLAMGTGGIWARWGVIAFLTMAATRPLWDPESVHAITAWAGTGFWLFVSLFTALFLWLQWRDAKTRLANTLFFVAVIIVTILSLIGTWGHSWWPEAHSGIW